MKYENTEIRAAQELDLETQKGYSNFLRWVIKYADCFCLSYKGFDYKEFTESKWKYLIHSLIRYEEKHSENPTVILYLTFDHVTIEFLKSKKHIFDFWDAIEGVDTWEWLWDIGFIKDGKHFFSSCTHEGVYEFE